MKQSPMIGKQVVEAGLMPESKDDDYSSTKLCLH